MSAQQARIGNLVTLFTRMTEDDAIDFTTMGVVWPQVAQEIIEALGLNEKEEK